MINIGKYDISKDVLNVINIYTSILTDNFINIISRLNTLDTNAKMIEFFKENISNDSDSRMFEITSFVILKNHYASQNILIGNSKENLKEEPLVLYKTGRTNANDGGIDYVMKPIGTFFQVTETLDFKKFFLDIEKINRYPITFVIKTEDTKKMIIKKISEDARKKYPENVIIKYLKSIEDVITISDLLSMLESINDDKLPSLLSDFRIHLEMEFNLK